MSDQIQSSPKAEDVPVKAQAASRKAAPAKKEPAGQGTKPAAKSAPKAKSTTAPVVAAAAKPKVPVSTAATPKAPVTATAKPKAPVAAAAKAKTGAKPPTPVKTPAPAAAARPAVPTKATRTKKHAPAKPKLVRDSFTLPESDYAMFATLKQRALSGGAEVKKSELVRAGLAMLTRADDAEFLKAVALVERIKTGRPKK